MTVRGALYSSLVLTGPVAPRRTRGMGWTISALAVLCGLLGVLAALAPVEVNDPVLSWPQAGQEPLSTIVPLNPYRPLQLNATVPCHTLANLQPTGGEALRTLPATAALGKDQGLVVSASGARVHVVASGSTLLDETIPGTACNYEVSAGPEGVSISRDHVGLVRRAGLLVPEVAELVTDARGPAATAGLAVQVHTDARYQSRPSTLKIVLLIAHALSLLTLLAVGVRAWSGRRRRSRNRSGCLVRPRLALPDALVVAVSAAWAFLGPVNVDDSWYLLMARNAGTSGYVGNYINMFNSSENPFVLSQYLMQGWGSIGGWGLLWMRLLPVMYGIGTYALLRPLLATVLGARLQQRESLRRRAPWALALAHLLWWLPYGITLRPEPLIVLASAVVLLLAELARQRRSLGVLAVATSVAALAMTVSPTALVAATPLLLNVPWVWRWQRMLSWPHRIGAIGLLLASTTAVVPVGFGDATVGDVRESTAVRAFYYYFRYHWYDEFRHYVALMEGTWSVRLPVLLTLAVLGAALVAVGANRGSEGPVSKATAYYATTTVLALVALTPTPSKWVNHFGAIAAPATMLLALALLRTPVPRRARVAAGVISSGLVIAAAAVGFDGPNGWRPFSDWGQPFGYHLGFSTIQVWSTAPHFGQLRLNNLWLWLLVAGAALGWARRRRSGPGRLTVDRGVLGVAMTLAVVLVLGVFAYAPLRQYPGPSVASVNLSSAIGSGCGLAPHVQVTDDGRQETAAQLLNRRPVFIDQVSAGLFPCVNQVLATNGMVQAPQYTVRVGDGLEEPTKGNAYIESNGGAFAAISRTTTFVELPSRLSPEGVPTLPWGHVSKVVYSYPVGLFDLQVDTVQRAGWQRQPTLATQAYTGRDNSVAGATGP